MCVYMCVYIVQSACRFMERPASMSVGVSCIAFHPMPFNFYFSCETLNAQHHDGRVEVEHSTHSTMMGV